MTDILERMYASAVRLMAPLSLEETYAVVIEESTKLAEADFGSIFIYNKKSFNRVYTTVPPQSQMEPNPKGNSYLALKRGEPLYIPLEKLAKTHPESKTLKIYGLMLIPLRHEKESVGVIAVQYMHPVDVKDDVVKTLKVFGSLASLGIRKNQLLIETKEALESRDMFIAMVAHEVRTPLTSINVYVQLLKRKLTPHSPVEKILIDRLSYSTNRLIRLINEFFHTDQIRCGKSLYTWRTCKLGDIVQKSISEFMITHPQKLIKVKNRIKNNHDSIKGDSHKLSQVLSDLLGNSWKYSAPQSEINVSLKEKEQSLSVLIKDYGKGISETDLPHVFEQFYRGKNGQFDGMGLGLYLSKKIIEDHGGQISISSKVNVGTTVEIVLPRQ